MSNPNEGNTKHLRLLVLVVVVVVLTEDRDTLATVHGSCFSDKTKRKKEKEKDFALRKTGVSG